MQQRILLTAEMQIGSVSADQLVQFINADSEGVLPHLKCCDGAYISVLITLERKQLTARLRWLFSSLDLNRVSII